MIDACDREKQLERQLQRSRTDRATVQKLKTRLLELSESESNLSRTSSDLEGQLKRVKDERDQLQVKYDKTCLSHRREIDVGKFIISFLLVIQFTYK